MPGRRTDRRPDLDQLFDFESRPMEEPDNLAVREVEFDRFVR
jgi:hypothetical protein